MLAVRTSHAGATLADHYTQGVTPPDLRRAHSALDRAFERIYRSACFTAERERVEYLFAVYERLQASLLPLSGNYCGRLRGAGVDIEDGDAGAACGRRLRRPKWGGKRALEM